MMGSTILPELELDKDEAKKLGDAAREVGRHYQVLFDPKHVAIGNLLAVAGFIYGPRAIAWRARKRRERDSGAEERTEKLQPVPKTEPTRAAAPAAPKPAQRANGYAAPSQVYGYEPAEEFPGLG